MAGTQFGCKNSVPSLSVYWYGYLSLFVCLLFFSCSFTHLVYTWLTFYIYWIIHALQDTDFLYTSRTVYSSDQVKQPVYIYIWRLFWKKIANQRKQIERQTGLRQLKWFLITEGVKCAVCWASLSSKCPVTWVRVLLWLSGKKGGIFAVSF